MTLNRWIESDAFRRWFAENVDDATEQTLHLEGTLTGVNVQCKVTDGTRTWLLRWRRIDLGSHQLDLECEYRLVDALDRVGIPVARPIAFCADEELTQKPFYVMENLDAVTPASPSAVQGRSHDDRRHRSEQVADVLLGLRTFDPAAHGLDDMLLYADSDIDRMVGAWEQRRQPAIPELDQAIRRVRAVARPVDTSPVLLHGDFHPYNIMLEPTAPSELVAIIDWEAAKVGKQGLDLVRFLLSCDDAIAVPAGFRPHGSPPGGYFDRDTILDRYLDGSGEDPARLRYLEGVEALRGALYHHLVGTDLKTRSGDGDPDPRASKEGVVRTLVSHALDCIA